MHWTIVSLSTIRVANITILIPGEQKLKLKQLCNSYNLPEK